MGMGYRGRMRPRPAGPPNRTARRAGGSMTPRRLRVRFQVSLVSLVSALVALLAAGLIWLQFDRTTAIMHEAAYAYIDQVAERTAERVDGQFDPVLRELR